MRLMTKQLRIGLAGLGTVGASLVRLLQTNGAAIGARAGRPMAITAVSARDRKRDRGIDLSGLTWFDDAIALAGSADIDCFVELIGGDEGPARESRRGGTEIRASMWSPPTRRCWPSTAMPSRLWPRENGVHLAFEASAAPAEFPSSRPCARALAGNRVNTALRHPSTAPATTSSRGWKRRASPSPNASPMPKRLGYAEADPTFDIEGYDTAHKLALLTSLAFGTQVDSGCDLCRGDFGHRPARSENGRMISAFASSCSASPSATRTGIEQRVHPTMVPRDSAIAQVMGVTNAVTIDADAVGLNSP